MWLAAQLRKFGIAAKFCKGMLIRNGEYGLEGAWPFNGFNIKVRYLYTHFFNSVILMVTRARIPTAEKLKALRSQTQLNMSHQIATIMVVISIWPAVNKKNIVLIMKSTKEICLIKEKILQKVSWKK